jgi:Bestrophin, RFP-TM, chloride channel
LQEQRDLEAAAKNFLRRFVGLLVLSYRLMTNMARSKNDIEDLYNRKIITKKEFEYFSSFKPGSVDACMVMVKLLHEVGKIFLCARISYRSLIYCCQGSWHVIYSMLYSIYSSRCLVVVHTIFTVPYYQASRKGFFEQRHGVSETNMASVTRCISQIRANVGDISQYVNVQLPFPFIQIVASTSYCFIVQLFFVASSFIAYGLSTNNSSYTVLGILTISMYNFVLLGMLKLFVVLCNPMGEDVNDFPLIFYENNLEKKLKLMADQIFLLDDLVDLDDDYEDEDEGMNNDEGEYGDNDVNINIDIGGSVHASNNIISDVGTKTIASDKSNSHSHSPRHLSNLPSMMGARKGATLFSGRGYNTSSNSATRSVKPTNSSMLSKFGLSIGDVNSSFMGLNITDMDRGLGPHSNNTNAPLEPVEEGEYETKVPFT